MKQKVTEITKVIGLYCKENLYLIFLIIVSICLRAGYPLTGHFSFTFDQGKDVLNALEMIVTRQPKLVGPWTSISGLYFGPAWYYFLAVCMLVGKLSPAAPVWGMIVLNVIQIVLVYRYFGKIAATTVTAGTLWQTISISAWNPFPLTLVSWGILILLLRTSRDKKLTAGRAFGFGFLAALGWHFSSAYAVFYPIIILLCWLYEKLIINFKVIFFTILGFMIPFLPQAVFELRHDFPEIRAIVNYVQGGDPQPADKTGWDKIDNLLKVTWGEWEISAFPNIVRPGDLESKWLARVWVASWWVLAAGVGYVVVKKKADLPELLVESLAFVVIPVLGYFFLHFNVWYLLGMAPAGVLIVAKVLEKYPKYVQNVWMTLLLIGGGTIWAREFVWEDNSGVDSYYLVWAQVWDRVKEIAGERTYNLYTYRADIYDYNMQYLVLWEGLVNGYRLPADFAYKPGENAYVPMKAAIAAGLETREGMPEVTIYVLDHPDVDSGYFLEWAGQNPDFARAEYVETVGMNIQIWEASAGGEVK